MPIASSIKEHIAYLTQCLKDLDKDLRNLLRSVLFGERGESAA